MNRIVTRVQRGRSAGKFQAKIDHYANIIVIGTFDTEDQAWGSFDDFEATFDTKKLPRKAKKLTPEEWKEKSKAQVALFSKIYK